MKIFWKIWWRSTVAGAVAAAAFWAIVGSIGPVQLRPPETPSRAVLTPGNAAAWMRAPVAAGQPAWITEASHVAR